MRRHRHRRIRLLKSCDRSQQPRYINNSLSKFTTIRQKRKFENNTDRLSMQEILIPANASNDFKK